MCLGEIALLLETWEDDGVLVGRLDTGAVLPLAFVPGASVGDYLLLHLGLPVEVLDDERAREAIGLRADLAKGGIR